MALADRWILSRLDATIEDANRLMEPHHYGEAGKTIREFVWSELCDWYIEAAKVRLRGSPRGAAGCRADAGLRHGALSSAATPLHALRHRGALAGAATRRRKRDDRPLARGRRLAMNPPRPSFGALIETVRAIRNARTEAGIEPGRWIAAEVFAGQQLMPSSRAARAGHAGAHRRRRSRIPRRATGGRSRAR